MSDRVRRSAQGQPAHHRQHLGRQRAGEGASRRGAGGAHVALHVCAFVAAGAAQGSGSRDRCLADRQRSNQAAMARATPSSHGRWQTRPRSPSKMPRSTTRRATLRRSRSGSAWPETFTIQSPRPSTRRRCWGGRFPRRGRDDPNQVQAMLAHLERGHRVGARGDAHVAPRSPPVRRPAVRALRPAAPAGAGVPRPCRESDPAGPGGDRARFPRRST